MSLRINTNPTQLIITLFTVYTLLYFSNFLTYSLDMFHSFGRLESKYVAQINK